MGSGRGPRNNQPKLTFRNHLQPLDSIGQANAMNKFLRNFKNVLFQQIFYCLTHSLMHSVKRSRKLATATASFPWQNCLVVKNLLSYSTVVLYIGIMKVWGFWPKIISPKPA